MSWVDATTLRCELDHRVARWTLGAEQATDVLRWASDENDATAASAMAPGDQHVAYLRHHQLWLAAADGRVRQLTFDGSPDIVYGGAAHRAEFGITGGLFWSADGRFLAFYREDQRPIAP
ncbi:MAG: DPP IV N-terminal domain-containing protein, partial [Planctomycetes bacterium]|nr:DPP IV N-terminal domain-containing protein [Planctomycetota bacterium]